MKEYADNITLDGKPLRRVITPQEDPKCGVIVTTEYFDGDKVVRKDVHVEVSREASAAGLIGARVGI